MRHVPVKSKFSRNALYSSMFTTLGLASCPVAHALEILPSVEAQATITDNVDFGVSDERQSGAILTVTPTVRIRETAGALRIDGSAGFRAIYFSEGLQKNRILPRIDLTLSADLVRNLFTLEAGVRSEQYSVSPLGLQLDGDSTANRFTSVSYRINPRLEKELSPGLKISANSENTLTKTTVTERPVPDWISSNSIAYVERRPTPIGWRLEAKNESTRFRQTNGNFYRNTSGKGFVSYSPAAEFLVSVSAGRERARTSAGETKWSTAGAELTWSPSERTSLQAGGERRFFGNAWNFSLSHRMPWLAVSARLSQDVTSFPTVVSTLPATDNVAGLLDGILTTRIADSQERSKAVQNLMNRFGIPSSLPGDLSLYSDNFLLARGGVVRLVLLGNRASLTLTASRNKSRDLPGLLTPLSTLSLLNRSRNQQISLGLNYRFSEVTTLIGSVAESRTDTQADDLRARQRAAEVTINRVLTPSTTVLAGARLQRFTLTNSSPTRESAIFAGISHRF
jgi:uncharacterized protein (PEP-CTERM system associated)